LVVGGSLVGLSSAVFLAWRGVPTVLVERHPASSPHPRAIGFTPRTLELFRAAGLGERIPQAPPGLRLRRIKVESLAGKWLDEVPWTPEGQQAPTREYSPCRGAALAQDRLEPILREQAISLGADVRLETEFLGFTQDANGVVASLRDREGETSELRAAYLIAADGHRSNIRESLGIGRSGRGHLRTLRSVIFRAPLEEYRSSGFSQFEVLQPGFEAFLTTYGDGRWILFFSDDVERDDASLRASISRAIGTNDLEIEIVTTGRFEISALIADRFASGRVFLAGDSAHTLPPNRGGYGANTGIEDAHNLAWKLSAVLSGASTPKLLETYDAERRPIAWLRHQQIFARADFKAHSGERDVDVPVFDDAAMEFGQLYRSAAVLGADEKLAPAMRPDLWAGQPGTRAPHLWLTKEGKQVSTLDLFQREWVLLSESDRWSPVVARVSESLGIEVKCIRVGADVDADANANFQPSDQEAFRSAFGLSESGASLIRPDGYVAWRSLQRPTDAVSVLSEVVGQVASAAKRTNPAANSS
jgi:2-polyprenyl-6-methoxyphenol hydroxylase-like FAD-dependent oxidoreductase